MGTLSEISRARKNQLRSLLVASRRLDAAQEALEREAKRLSTRKRAIPELADAQRLLELVRAVNAALDNLIKLLESLARAWAST